MGEIVMKVKRKRKICACGKPSVPGLIRSVSLCQYHFNEKVYGKRWADICESLRVKL